jgi:hypothetical protein
MPRPADRPVWGRKANRAPIAVPLARLRLRKTVSTTLDRETLETGCCRRFLRQNQHWQPTPEPHGATGSLPCSRPWSANTSLGLWVDLRNVRQAAAAVREQAGCTDTDRGLVQWGRFQGRGNPCRVLDLLTAERRTAVRELQTPTDLAVARGAPTGDTALLAASASGRRRGRRRPQTSMPTVRVHKPPLSVFVRRRAGGYGTVDRGTRVRPCRRRGGWFTSSSVRSGTPGQILPNAERDRGNTGLLRVRSGSTTSGRAGGAGRTSARGHGTRLLGTG